MATGLLSNTLLILVALGGGYLAYLLRSVPKRRQPVRSGRKVKGRSGPVLWVDFGRR